MFSLTRFWWCLQGFFLVFVGLSVAFLVRVYRSMLSPEGRVWRFLGWLIRFLPAQRGEEYGYLLILMSCAFAVAVCAGLLVVSVSVFSVFMLVMVAVSGLFSGVYELPFLQPGFQVSEFWANVIEYGTVVLLIYTVFLFEFLILWCTWFAGEEHRKQHRRIIARHRPKPVSLVGVLVFWLLVVLLSVTGYVSFFSALDFLEARFDV